jgi:hypothetical protein
MDFERMTETATAVLTTFGWQVYFDINRAISDTFGAAGYPVPEEHVHMRQPALKQA